MSTGKITWNGHDSTEFGAYVSGTNAHNAAEADMTAYQIPGRNGDLVISNNRYKNIVVTYPAFIPHSLSGNEQALRNWLRSSNGYERLDDTYDTTHFRLARTIGELVFDPARPNAANFEIAFDCMPQRFLLSGEDEERPDDNGDLELDNPTQFYARPIIVTEDIGNGTEIEFSNIATGKVWTLTATDDYSGLLTIDCERMDIYDATTMENKNDMFDMPDGFPELGPGVTNVKFTGTATDAFILPRWWEL